MAVIVDVQRAVSMRAYVPLKPVPPATVPVSGAPAVGPVMPPICGRSLSLALPGSQYRLNLFFGDTCAVMRSVGLIVPSVLLETSRLVSGE